jgi:thiol:disulfide interchange protein DsbA
VARGANESAKVRRARNAILAVLGAVVLAVIGIGLWSTLEPVGEIAPGTHYTVLPEAERPRTGPVVVTEYFSYGCVHCANFDPQLEDWREELPGDVRFERVPVAFSPDWRALAAAYYAAQDLGVLERNHSRLFDAIHETRLNLASPDALAQFFDGHGTDGAAFRRALGSPAVRRAVAEAETRTRDAGIRSVPTLVVDGRYRIDAAQLSRQQILAVADQLIERERAARGAG